MMRFATLLVAAIAVAGPALADEPQVTVLRGSSAPPTPWYQPPPEPRIVVQQVHVPLYYLPVVPNPFFFDRHRVAPSARRNR
jgi:hypothetical protein